MEPLARCFRLVTRHVSVRATRIASCSTLRVLCVAGNRAIFLVVTQARNERKISEFSAFEGRLPAGNSSFGTKI